MTTTTQTLLAALRRAATAEAAQPTAEAWDLSEAADARSLTEAAGMRWDFTTWADALSCAEAGRLGGVEVRAA